MGTLLDIRGVIENGVMFQFFHWHSPADGSLFKELGSRAEELSSLGVTSVWIPPAYKGADGADSPGYAVYDLFDLGEFEQKGAVRTKYGTRDELTGAVQALRQKNIRVYADIVFNQRSGADEVEDVEGTIVDPENRNEVQSPPVKFRAWTRFDFPGRGDLHSAMKWNAGHFVAVDCNADAPPEEKKIYLLSGKTFSGDVSEEKGNFDFLLGCDVDTYHPDVREELFHFGRWFVDTTAVDGFRLDALKHLPAAFMKDWLNHLRAHFGGRELYAVGEYWTADLEELNGYLGKVEGTMDLFDVPLHYRFLEASQAGNDFDLRTVFDGTLTQSNALAAVTFVDNHDTQPGSSLQSWVEPWFKPLAYALILLRREGYPCVFHPDYYGFDGEPALASHRTLLDAFLKARAEYNHGEQTDYFDHPNCIAWLRAGTNEHPGKMVVVLSNGDAGSKRVQTGAPGASFHDVTGHEPDAVTTDGEGAADFRCPAGSVSVWVQD